MSMNTTNSFNGLLLVQNSQYAEDNRHINLQIQLHNSICYALAHIIKMRRISLYYGTQYNVCIWCAFGIGIMLLYTKGQFNSPGYYKGFYVNTRFFQYFLSALFQSINDGGVPFCFNDNNKGILRCGDAFV